VKAVGCLMMEAVCSSETSVYFQWTTQHYIPEGSTLPIFVKFDIGRWIKFFSHFPVVITIEQQQQTLT
jgi:hypothetical protein